MRSFVFAALPLALLACSDETTTSSSGGAPADAGTDRASPTRDGGVDPSGGEDAGADADEPALPSANEKEPNDGATETEIGAMTIPGIMHGVIDPKNDVDIFAITPAPGELWEWTLTPAGADLAPHLTIFDTAPNNTTNPNVLARGTAAQTITLQHFVLGTGKLVAVVRDARNVPTKTDRGGPTYGYTLTAKKTTPKPVAVTFPSVHDGKLASLSSVDLYSFTATAGKEVDVIIRADRKAVPSTLDSRLSLFSTTTGKSLGTNDDAMGGTTDSQLGGALPAGNVIVVVESEGTDPTDLSYEIEFALR